MNRLIRTLLSLEGAIIILGVVVYSAWGIPLFGLPGEEAIQSVEILDTRISEESQVFSQTNEIKNAKAAASLLHYKWGALPQEEPFLFVTYHLKDGGTVTVSVSENTVVYNGKTRLLKQGDGLYANVIEGIFFPANSAAPAP